MQALSLENGKYELRFDEASGALTAWRYGEPWQDFTGNKFIYLLMQAALAAADAQPVDELVAWQQSNYDELDGWGGWYYVSPGDAERTKQWVCRSPKTRRIRPLYATPPAQPAAQAPLAREQIDAIWSSQGSFTDRESDYRCFARAIERAHGIGGKP